VALLQEVTHTDFTKIHNYTATVNEGTDKRGMAFLVKTGLDVQHIKRIPSGRGIAAMFQGIWIINIYAPSGAEKRVERECFFNNEFTFLLPTDSNDVIIAGDFNCVNSPADCTERPTMSRALMTLIKGRSLRDVWETHPHTPAYTHYTNAGASRIDRICHKPPKVPETRGGNNCRSLQRPLCSNCTYGLGRTTYATEG
jgi:exonuclease III